MKLNNLKMLNVLIISTFVFCVGIGQTNRAKPVTPGASPEAIALLDLFYNISGNYILTGQHNYPNIKDRNSQFAAEFIGKYPVIFSTDWGFEKAGNTDSYLARPDIVNEAIRQHNNGAIVTICWHAVPPTADEPVTFRPLPGADPDSLASIQGQLTDHQFQDVLTPGTFLNNHWCSQVDSIAKYLKLLEEAHVPVLWRPYHEMNGSWFWWGGRQGKYSTVALYKQLFDRLVNVHKLKNLVWMWNIDRPHNEQMNFRNFFPGSDFLDIVSLDVYHNDFSKAYYDSLLVLANGKPLAFGEVGNPPAIEVLNEQPRWASYVVWAGMVRNTPAKQYNSLLQDGRYLFLKDREYNEISASYRKSVGLVTLKADDTIPVNLSGSWLFSEERSQLGNSGAGMVPYKIRINQSGNQIEIFKTMLLEYADKRIDTLKLATDGTEYKSEIWNAPVITTASWSEGNDSLLIKSVITFTRDDQAFESVTEEKWVLSDFSQVLIIGYYSNSYWGERKMKMVYNRVFIE